MYLEKFLKMDKGLVEIDNIGSIDLEKLESDYLITIVTKQGITFIATELNAIECIMQIRPASLEGKRLKWAKRVWYVHNLVGHPLMQILVMLGLRKWGFYVHDVTVPKPLGFKAPKNK